MVRVTREMKQAQASRMLALNHPEVERRRAERQCFWTWPWGHQSQFEPGELINREWVGNRRPGWYCVHCGHKDDAS